MRTTLATLAALGTTVLGSVVSAQASGTLDRFSASESPHDDFHISRPETGDHLQVGGQLTLDYALNPLVFESKLGESDTESAVIVAHHLVGTAGFSLGLGGSTMVFVGLPVTLVMSGDSDPTVGGQALVSADGAGLGDLRLGARQELVGGAGDAWSMGVQATLLLPTASLAQGDQRFLGESSFAVHPELLLGFSPGADARLVFNVGTIVRETSEQSGANLTFGTELTWGLGYTMPLWSADQGASHVDAHAQVYGATTLGEVFEREATPVEGTVGLKWFDRSGLLLGLAAGPGLVRGVGSPDLRVVATLGWEVPSVALVDSDGDGLPDPDDGCPTDPEDKDGWQDEDGCPDPDNDGDTFPDDRDGCPNDPETVNQHEDTDGCPDSVPDQDGDGFLDPDDGCPTEPEDEDGFEDLDGCPDPDNDGDGVPDVVDNCPMQPGVPEQQGCEAPQHVTLTEERIETLDTIYFKFDKDVIEERSFELLQNVAAVIQAHPEIAKVRIEGHTDERGTREYNIDLSRRRAAAVRKWLIDKGGIAADRLTSEGHGFDRPIVPKAKTAEEHGQNRRVEFHIVGARGEIKKSGNKATSDTSDR